VAGQARAVTGKVEMTTLMLIIGSIVLFAGAFATWYTVWHLRIGSRLERIRVPDGRSALVPRQGVASGGDQQ
jgi:hypothetical protein